MEEQKSQKDFRRKTWGKKEERKATYNMDWQC
jgi:hypothetical protein